MVPILRPFLGLLLCVTAFKGYVLHRAVRDRWIFTIGGMCYSLYLTHTLVVFLVVKASFGPAHLRGVSFGLPGGYLPNFLAVFTLFVAAILFVGGAYFVGVERPFMNRALPRRLGAFLRRALRVDPVGPR